MPGEPEWFDVAKLEAIEIETATGEQFPSNIIDWGEKFFLRATFKGTGNEWYNMKTNRFAYVANFYAEGMGPGVGDKDFGTMRGNLAPGSSEYQVDSPVTSIADEGIWRCGVTVTFQGCNSHPWYGVLGFNEDCVIQISALEEKE